MEIVVDATTVTLFVCTMTLVSVAITEWRERAKANYKDLLFVYMMGPSESMARIKSGQSLDTDPWTVCEFWTIVVAMFRRGMLPRFFWDPEEPFYVRAREYMASKAGSDMSPRVREVLESVTARRRRPDKED